MWGGNVQYATLGDLLVIILVTVIMVLSNPLRKSQEQIRENILTLTPIGTSMEDVIKVIEINKKWEVRYISYEQGYLYQGAGERKTIGEKSIRVFMGDYGNIFVTSVTVFWGFHEDSKLIDIWVWKDKDSL